MATDSLERYLESQSGLPNPSVLSSGECIDGWRVCALIGRGGTSEVYRVERAVDGFVAALKLLKIGGESDVRHRSRFLREVKLLAETTSPCFPRLYASGETASGSPYLVEELLESRELPRTDRAVAEYVLSVCRGVGELHRRGIVHRDLKPANILFRADGTAVIADLGLAKEPVASVCNDGVSIADGRPVGVGTPGYSAPEQFLNGEASSASDIHAIGVLIDACFKDVVPRAWRGIVRRATSSLPAQRYGSICELARAVSMRHWFRWVVALSAVVLVTGLVWVRWMMVHLDEHVEVRADSLLKTVESGDELAEDVRVKAVGSGDELAEDVRDKTVESGDELAEDVCEIENSASIRYGDGGGADEESSAVRVLEKNGSVAETSLESRLFEKPVKLAKPVTDAGASNWSAVNSGWPREVRLNGGKKILREPLVLSEGGTYWVVGPGTLDADISGPEGTTLILKDCVVINRTLSSLKRGIRYRLDGGVYLNFINHRGDNRLRPPCVEPYDGAFNEFRYSGPETLSELMRQRSLESMSLMVPQSSEQNL